MFGSSRFERESMGVYAYVKIYSFFWSGQWHGIRRPRRPTCAQNGQPGPRFCEHMTRMGKHRRKKHERPQAKASPCKMRPKWTSRPAGSANTGPKMGNSRRKKHERPQTKYVPRQKCTQNGHPGPRFCEHRTQRGQPQAKKTRASPGKIRPQAKMRPKRTTRPAVLRAQDPEWAKYVPRQNTSPGKKTRASPGKCVPRRIDLK